MLVCSTFHLFAFLMPLSFYDCFRQLPVGTFSVQNLFTRSLQVIRGGKGLRFLKIL